MLLLHELLWISISHHGRWSRVGVQRFFDKFDIFLINLTALTFFDSFDAKLSKVSQMSISANLSKDVNFDHKQF
jgi:hypothetical protein